MDSTVSDALDAYHAAAKRLAACELTDVGLGDAIASHEDARDALRAAIAAHEDARDALRAAIAAYADAERQAGRHAGLHAGQEQGRHNAAIEGAAGRTDADEARGLVGAAYAAAFDIGALTGRHGVHAAADAAEIYARHLAARAALLAALGVADDGGGAS